MKKLLFLICSCLILTGCQVDYELYFNDGGIEENIVSKFDYDIYEVAEAVKEGDSIHIEEILTSDKLRSLIDEEEYYEKNIVVKDNKSIATLKYNYTYDNFEKSYLIDKCFENKIFINDSNYYYLSLGGEFYCFENKNVNINVSTDRKVIYHNADEVKDRNYIWNLDMDEEEYDVVFQVSKSDEAIEKTKDKKMNIFPMIGLIIFAIAFLMIFLLKRKINKDE